MRSWLKECVVLKMKESDAAWLAGFFDGEGTLCHSMGGRKHKYPAWVLAIGNTHLASLERCQQITGAGSILFKSQASDRRKAQWAWRVSSQRNIAAILEQMLPHLTTKREKALDFFANWQDV